jgi:hypothetical protein
LAGCVVCHQKTTALPPKPLKRFLNIVVHQYRAKPGVNETTFEAKPKTTKKK